MSHTRFFALIFLMLMAGRLRAQNVNTDSLKLIAQISKEQLRLGKMQNQVSGKIKDKQDAASQATKSANENQRAASDLASDPQNKQLAHDADKLAGRANRDARKARKAAANLDQLNQSIAESQQLVAKLQGKLAQYRALTPAAAVISTDSTQHR
jgi:small-conductance mechanosensitive channel